MLRPVPQLVNDPRTPGNTAATGFSARALPLLALAFALLPSLAGAAPVERPHILVELVAEHETLRPGQTATVGIRLGPDPGWHVYWRNPGDSGLPPRIEWNLPTGYALGPLAWPHPETVSTPPYVTYGYHDAVMLLANLGVPASARPGSDVTLAAQASWLVCQADACVPGKADLALTIPVEASQPHPDSRWVEDFATARADLPRPLEGWATRAWNEGDEVVLELVAPRDSDPQLTELKVYPLEQGVLDHAAEQKIERAGRRTSVRLARSPDRSGAVHELGAVLVSPDAWNFAGDAFAVSLRTPVAADEASAVATTVAVSGTGGFARNADRPQTASTEADGAQAPAAIAVEPLQAEVVATVGRKEPGAAREPASTKVSPPTPVRLNNDAPPAPSFLTALLLAFVGGLILNLMPCVFPVLSLKILGFVQSAHHEPAEIRRHGHLFAAGVIVSFLLLAGLLLLLREGGRELGWGFQLQSPAFVAVMVLLVFTMGLNLAGVFEIGGAALGAAAGRLDRGSGYSGAFFSGALATVLATPCTAPFMGTALGFALAQPAATALAVFASIGAGMAAPYVLLSYQPSLLARLPRPGQWMVTLKQAMAFPLFATVVWLLWIFGQQTGNDAVMRLLGALVVVALGAWLAGRLDPTAVAAGRRRLGRAVTALVLVTGLYAGLTAAELPASRPACAAECSTGDGLEAGGWVAFDHERIGRLRAAGRPVFLDFTAAWCLSCKVNERVAFGSELVWQRFEERKVVAMKADWTNGDPEITRALAEFGRSSVPLYVLYPADPEAAPIILPEILSPQIVLDALAAIPAA